MTFISTANPEASRQFSQEVLVLRLLEENKFTLVFKANGTMVRIGNGETLDPVPYTLPGWQVASIESAVDVLIEKGVLFERFKGLEADARGIMTFPDGNLLSLAQLV